MIYLDNSATSFPKPKETIDRLNNFVSNVGGNPGRSGHTASVEAARIIFDARESLADFIHCVDSKRLIFTSNGTESINLAILGIIGQGDHVITTSMEHNSVMRPLTFLQKTRGLEVSIAQCSPEGDLDPLSVKKLIKRNTKAVIVNHGSNVIGTIHPLREIRECIDGIPFIVDACQTVGSYPIDIMNDGIDILCFSCHKSLFSIQGLGAIYIREGIELTPLKFGGTGSKSEHIVQPDFLPDKYESGTPNTPSIASLLGGLEFIAKRGIISIIERKKTLRSFLLNQLFSIEGVKIYGDVKKRDALPILSFTMKNKTPSDIGFMLDKEGIYVRVGLHCSPMAHKTIGTFPVGTVRVSPGFFTTEEEILLFGKALKKIADQ